ncbi:MAG: Rrf2 family transcriptional regulator [Gemmataceae bacterium]
MTLLNRKIDYALLILCFLYRKAEGGCARQIADHYGISRPFVANILKDLCQNGFVASLRGVRGGYLLQPFMEEATLVDLIDRLDDPVRLVECNHEQPEACCVVSDACPVR